MLYKQQLNHFFLICVLVFIGACFSESLNAQALVDKKISGNYNNTRLIDILKDIEEKGDLYFSYNGKYFPKDSLITFTVKDQPISNLLTKLFEGKFEFEVSKRYVILTPFLPRMLLENLDITPDNKYFSISGVVVSASNGQRLMNASIYNKYQLRSTLSDKDGYFKIKVKPTDSSVINLTVSKVNFKDAELNFLQNVNVSMRANARFSAKSTGNNGVDTISLSTMLTSARQRIQSMNITDFIATRPVQLSLTPGLSTHGMLSTQVVNKASLNLLGGYTAGVNGVEVGGIFNINRSDARYFQVAGIFNLVGGNLEGMQTAGVYNLALDTVKGIQLAGFINKAESKITGVQMSILHNEAKEVHGLQVGLVNSADTLKGISIGLFNIIRNGFYKVSFSSNNIASTNLSFKSGTHTFYNSLRVGADFIGNHRMFYLGYGVGHDFLLSQRFYISSEAGYNFVNRGYWGDQWLSGKLLLNLQLIRKFSLFWGATINSYKESADEPKIIYNGISYNPIYNEKLVLSSETKKTFGWEVGVSYNSVFRKGRKNTLDNSTSWFLGIGLNSGVVLNMPYKNSYGAEITINRDLGNNVSAVASIGFTQISSYKNYITYSDRANSYYYNRIEATAYQIVPLKVGVRSRLAKNFYIGGDLGEAWAYHDLGLISTIEGKESRIPSHPRQVIKSLMYSAVVGFRFTSGLDVSGKFEHFLAFPGVQQLGLRIAYQIKLGK
jgi:hypothetical protein